MNSIKDKKILIIDFGSQYTRLIARRVREMGVYSEIYPYDYDFSQLNAEHILGVILSGGPDTVTLGNNPEIPSIIFTLNVPLLGICYGMQAMAKQLGGSVQSSNMREFGNAKVSLTGDCYLLSDIGESVLNTGKSCLDVWMSHGDKVTVLPNGFVTICETENAPIAGMGDEKRHWYGLQFHPEVTHSVQGEQILRRFILDICNAKQNWNTQNIIAEKLTQIKASIKDDKVLLGLSGGVDSSVVGAILSKAIGKQLVCVFVDSGLLRLNEVDEVIKMFNSALDGELIVIDAKERFLTALKGIDCPEEKRKIIGRVFIEVFETEACKHPEIKWLAQGTIYPDVIESAKGSNASDVIKSHHNVGGLPENLKLKLLEPLRELFKDEVRKLGIELGLPKKMINRHPFPGPGLAVRILGEIKEEYIEILRRADAIFIEELYKHNLYNEVSQAFAVFLPVKSVAVLGDKRHYDYVIALRAVQTIDFMTAKWVYLPGDFLLTVSNRIINEIKGISRVVYDISNKPPATIEWE